MEIGLIVVLLALKSAFFSSATNFCIHKHFTYLGEIMSVQCVQENMDLKMKFCCFGV
jgi:hypothetical protein